MVRFRVGARGGSGLGSGSGFGLGLVGGSIRVRRGVGTKMDRLALGLELWLLSTVGLILGQG